ncbi:helix-turn-helix domain-containing protein [Litoreibacter ascidiaceicola]|nr:helix-turn-helix domain-containing protein [Litoreibacter ascidiaceicola]
MASRDNHARRLRSQAGLTQKALSKLSGVDARTISRFETGGQVNQTTIAKIAAGLSKALEFDVEPKSLLDGKSYEDRLTSDQQGTDAELSDYARDMLNELRSKRDYGQGMLIDATGIDHQTIRKLEQDNVRVSADTARKIIRFVKEYLEDTDLSKPQSPFDAKSLSEIIRREMSRKGITRKSLARDAKISPSLVSKLLNDQIRPSDEVIGKLVGFLNLDEAELASLRFRSPSEGQQRKRISIRLSSDQFASIQAIASREGMSASRIIQASIGDGKALQRIAKEGKLVNPSPSVKRLSGPEKPVDQKRLTLNLSGEQAERLDEIAHETGISRSEVIHRALLRDGFLEEVGVDAGSRESANLRLFNSDQSDEAKRRLKMVQTAQSIPDQNPLVRFGVSENAKLSLIPTLVDENDYDTIEALRSELLAANGPIEHLKERYAQNPNVPQAGLFGRLTSKYDDELSKDPKDINYTVLYARGSRFYAARRRASQQIASGEWPELDADENEAIDAICDLHGPMIMASAAGRKLVEDAHQYEVPPDVYEEDQKTIEEFSQVIAAETELVEPETAEAYRELTAKTEGDPQPARSRGLGIAATGSALTVIVGGAAWYSAGGVLATFIVPATALGAAGLVGGFFWEAIKTMPRFKKATSAVGDQFEKALDQADKHAATKESALLKGMADLVERNLPLFEKVTELRPEFSWAKQFLVRKKPDQNENGALPKELKPSKHIVLMGPRGSGKSTIGKLLAERLGVGIVDFEYQITKRLEDNPHAFRERAGETRYAEVARSTLFELLAEAPGIIEFDLTLHDHEAILEPLKNKAAVVFLSLDRDLGPDLLPSDLRGIKYFSINVSNANKPEDTEEKIVRALVKRDDIFFPFGP